jgi:hypothetical protein
LVAGDLRSLVEAVQRRGARYCGLDAVDDCRALRRQADVFTDLVELNRRSAAQFRASRARDDEIYFIDGTAALA